jgi:hypothetical protein
MSAYTLYALIQWFWIGFSILWLKKRRDELPLVLSLFLFYIFSFRLWAILEGLTTPVDLSSFGLQGITLEAALDALGLGVLGQSVFLLAYMLTQRQILLVPRVIAPSALLERIRDIVFGLAIISVVSAVLARGWVGAQIAAGKSAAFEVSSYLSLLPLALIGIAILLGALWRAGAMNEFYTRSAMLVSFVIIALLTFQASLRFQFLGWVVAVTVILASGKSHAWRISLFTTGLVAAASMFAVAGALRSADDPDFDIRQSALERFAFAQDANMLDGFVLLRQVYPDLLNYSYGGEHLEILSRPIPRSVWPDKPVGGYLNKLGIIDANSGFTLGISPSLFGSFYQEGAIFGVVLLSALYGVGFGWLIRFSTKILPFTGLLVRGCACAALIPLLRGGDLPGIYAWFGMSFWPVALVMWLKRRELFRRGVAATSFSQQPAPLLR